MASVIEDGQGSGRQAGVNDSNELKVHATGSSLQDISNGTGRAYVTYLKRNLAAGAGSNETVGRILYDGSEKLFVSHVIVSTNEVAASSSTKVEMFFDTTSVSGGTSVSAIALNRGSNIASETTILSGATTITETTDDTKEFANARISEGMPTFTYEFGGGLILQNGDSFSIQCTSTTASARVRAQVWFFEGSGE